MSQYRKSILMISLVAVFVFYFFERSLIGKPFQFPQYLHYLSCAFVLIEVCGISVAKSLGFRFYLWKPIKYYILASTLFIIAASIPSAFKGYTDKVYLLVVALNVINLFMLQSGILENGKKILFRNFEIEGDTIKTMEQKGNVLLIQTNQKNYRLQANQDSLAEIKKNLGR